MTDIPIIPLNATADEAILKIFEQIPFLIPTVLFFIGAIMVIVGYLFEERRTGQARIQPWIAGVSFIITVVSVILYLYSGLIDGASVIISVAITIAAMLWFFLSE